MESEVAIIIAAVGAAVTAVLSSRGVLQLARIAGDYYKARAETEARHNAEAEAVRVLMTSKVDALTAEVRDLHSTLNAVRDNFARFYAEIPSHCPRCSHRIIDRDATPALGAKRHEP